CRLGAGLRRASVSVSVRARTCPLHLLPLFLLPLRLCHFGETDDVAFRIREERVDEALARIHRLHHPAAAEALGLRQQRGRIVGLDVERDEASPGLPEPFQGKEGVRQMIRMAPVELVQTPRDELVDGKNVKITTLTRAPGIFANYTTWNFEIDGSLVRRLNFELRAAN